MLFVTLIMSKGMHFFIDLSYIVITLEWNDFVRRANSKFLLQQILNRLSWAWRSKHFQFLYSWKPVPYLVASGGTKKFTLKGYSSKLHKVFQTDRVRWKDPKNDTVSALQRLFLEFMDLIFWFLMLISILSANLIK